MPTNPSGIYTLPPVTWVQSGDTVLPPQHNDPFMDVELAMTQRLMRDGRAPMTGALKMGSNKITGLATPTAATDGATKGYIDGRSITDFSGTLPLNRGGTGATTAAAARTALGLGGLATKNTANISGDTTGTLPLNRGGTGATTAAGVRANIGLDDIGLHITNTFPSINNLDRFDIPSGFGRYSESSAGTKPSNNNFGAFILLRRSDASGVMLAIPYSNNPTLYFRSFAGGAWDEWSGLARQDDPNMSNAREWTAATVSQAEAEAGAATTRRAWTAQRVRQAGVTAAKTVALGEGQSWVNMLSNRSANTVYQNTTGRTIAVSVGNQNDSSQAGLEVSANGTSGWMLLGAGAWATDMAIIPNGWRYRWTRAGTILRWAELR